MPRTTLDEHTYHCPVRQAMAYGASPQQTPNPPSLFWALRPNLLVVVWVHITARSCVSYTRRLIGYQSTLSHFEFADLNMARLDLLPARLTHALRLCRMASLNPSGHKK